MLFRSIPLLGYALLLGTKGYLSMFATALTWPLVGGWLPREVALPLSQFLAALLLSSLLCLPIHRLLRRFAPAR